MHGPTSQRLRSERSEGVQDRSAQGAGHLQAVGTDVGADDAGADEDGDGAGVGGEGTSVLEHINSSPEATPFRIGNLA